MHLVSWAVANGATVAGGTVIGYGGSTGRSSVAHLHFELWYIPPGNTGRSNNSGGIGSWALDGPGRIWGVPSGGLAGWGGAPNSLREFQRWNYAGGCSATFAGTLTEAPY